MTWRWRPLGLDSAGVYTVLALQAGGRDSGYRVILDGGRWLLTGGATLVDPPLVGAFDSSQRAMSAGERHLGLRR